LDNNIGQAECNGGATGIKTNLNLYSVIGSANFASRRHSDREWIPQSGMDLTRELRKFTDGRPIGSIHLRTEKNLAANLMVWAIIRASPNLI
jgi:hypothetical protein